MAWEYVGVQVGSEVSETYRPETKDRTATYTETAIYKSTDICNETETTLALYMQSLGHPVIGTESAANPGFYCIGRTFTLDTESSKATVAYEYSTHPNSSNQGAGNEGNTGAGGGNQGAPDLDTPPWAQGLRWSWSSSTIEIPMVVDANGQYVDTSAGEFIPGWTMPYGVQDLQITAYKTNFGASEVATYAQTINSKDFWGYRRFEALMQGISAEQVVWNNLLVWKVTYNVRLLNRGTAPNGAPIGWFTLAPDYGTVDSAGRTAEEVRGTSHAWLDAGSFISAPNANSWQYFAQYRTVDWTPLGLSGSGED